MVEQSTAASHAPDYRAVAVARLMTRRGIGAAATAPAARRSAARPSAKSLRAKACVVRGNAPVKRESAFGCAKWEES